MGVDASGNWELDGFDEAFTNTGSYDKVFKIPEIKPVDFNSVAGTAEMGKLLPEMPKVSFFDKMFESPSATISGIGALASGAGALYSAKMTKDYQNKILKMEEDRVNTNKERQAKQQAAFDKVWN